MPKKPVIDINHCLKFNILLRMCDLSEGECNFQSEPPKCPDYDDGNAAPRRVIPTVAPPIKQLGTKGQNSKDTESLLGFVQRIEGELDAMGIKSVRGQIEDYVPQKSPVPEDF